MEAILHIGVEKTGTSSLQAALSRQRQRLLDQGVHFSEAAGPESHWALPVFYADAHHVHDMLATCLISSLDERDLARESFERQLAHEVEFHVGKTFIFSSEHCHSRFLYQEEIIRLKIVLQKYFSSVKVVVYLRRQDRVAVSFRSTYIKGGGVGGVIFPSDNESLIYYDFEKLTDRWAAVFGSDNVNVRIYDRGELYNGSIVSDFCHAMSLKDIDDEHEFNVRLPVSSEILLAQLNDLTDSQDVAANIARDVILRVSKNMHDEFVFMPPRPEAVSFYQRFIESNERVRARFLPEKIRLFEEDFADYPESSMVENVASTSRLAAEVILQISTTVSQFREQHTVFHRKIADEEVRAYRFKEELHRLRAEKALSSEQWHDAIDRIEEGLRHNPSDRYLWDLLRIAQNRPFSPVRAW